MSVKEPAPVRLATVDENAVDSETRAIGAIGRDAMALAYSSLRRDILAGRHEPGSILNQVHVARELSISRGPLREALRRLESEGLVDYEANHRSRVSSLTPADAEELYVLRCVNERIAVQLSVPHLDDDELAQMKDHLVRLQTTDHQPTDEWPVVHARFHDLTISRAPRRIQQLVSELREHSGRYIRVCHRPGNPAPPIHEHQDLYDACLERDGALAADVVTRHLAHTAFGVLTVIDPLYEPSALRQILRGLISHVR